MVRVTAYLDDKIAAGIQECATRRGCSRGQIIREAVAAFIKQELAIPPKPVGIGKFRSGQTEIGRRAEELLGEAAREGRTDN